MHSIKYAPCEILPPWPKFPFFIASYATFTVSLPCIGNILHLFYFWQYGFFPLFWSKPTNVTKFNNNCDNTPPIIDIAATCNFWLGSSVMRCLLALTVHCFEKLDTGEKEKFVQQLLSTYMQHNSNFDWVVARLGSCFPHKIISEWVKVRGINYNRDENDNSRTLIFRVLACGLRVFVSTNGMGMDSEIGMISYLSFVQEAQLKAILMKLVKVSVH